MRSFRCLSSVLVLLAVGVTLPTSCGGRTGLEGPEPCYLDGEYRNCKNDCGSGNQICSAGYWQACEVPPTDVPCANDCGSGLSRCENNQQAECIVPRTSKECSNDCGSGQMWCENNDWGTCEVESKSRTCENTCGDGYETCENGVWGNCQVPRIEVACFSACGTGVEVCENDTFYACNAPTPLPPKLYATIRDFKIEHPDFEREDLTGSYQDRRIVAEDLGPDNLPVFIATAVNPTVTTKANFDQWFRDVPGVNQSLGIWLPTAASPTVPGLFIYEDTSFFPIDGQLFGNEGLPHNYHFTMTVQTEFVYVGGETFSFEGDDDMWVFINRKLAIDLGGIHSSMSASISLDEQATQLGLTPGGLYQLDFFFAERKTIQSDFTIRTTIADIGSCP